MILQATRINIFILLVVLGTLGCQPVLAQSSPWISQTVVTQYADNLISSYYAEVEATQSLRPNFTSIEQYFPLYHGVGQSFEVLVVKDKSNSTDNSVGFVFEPITSANPVVVVLDNETVQTFYTTPPITVGGQTYNQGYGPVFHTPYGVAAFYVSSNYPQFARYIPLIWTTNTTQVLENTQVNSKSAADVIYQTSVKISESISSSHTTEITTSQSQTTPSNQSPLGLIWDIIGGLSIVIGLVASILYLYKEGYLRLPKSRYDVHKERKQTKQRAEGHYKQEN